MSRVVRKRTFGLVRPVNIQISLRWVWPESLLGACWIAKNAWFLHVDNEDSSQLAFYINLQRAVSGPSATLTGR